MINYVLPNSNAVDNDGDSYRVTSDSDVAALTYCTVRTGSEIFSSSNGRELGLFTALFYFLQCW
jgi:hypothetical protein